MRCCSGVNRCFFLALARDNSLFISGGKWEPLASVFAVIPGRVRVLLKVVAQPGEGPAFFEAEALHLVTGSFGRHAEKVDFVKRRDKGGTIAPHRAMKVNGPKTHVGQEAENLTDVFFRRREGGRVHRDWNDEYAVLPSPVDLKTIEQGKELHRHDISDVLGLQETVIGVILRF